MRVCRIIDNLKPKIKRLWLLIPLFLLVKYYIVYLKHFSGSITTNPNSALYLLTTIVQSEVTIVAIIISLSVVVIQYYASSYSSRIIDILINDKKLWIPIILYGISIVSSLCLIRWIDQDNKYPMLENWYSLILTVSIIAHISLINSVSHFLKLMKPDSIINILVTKISIQSLSNSWISKVELPSRISKDEPRIDRITTKQNDEIDPILPVVDIINASIVRSDYATVSYGLKKVLTHYSDIIINNTLSETQIKKISEHVFDRIFKVCQLALNKKDVNSVDIMLKYYDMLGRIYIVNSQNLNSPCINYFLKQGLKILNSVYDTLGIQRSEERVTQNNFLMMSYVTFLSEYYLKEVFKSIIKIKNDDFIGLSKDLINCIHDIGMFTFHKVEISTFIYPEPDTHIQAVESVESSISELSYILGDIGVAAINSDSKPALDEVIYALNDIGKESIDKNLIHSFLHIIKNLNIIGKESAKKGVEFESSTKQIVECLENLASKINVNSETFSGKTQNQVIEYHKYIKLKYKYKTTEDALKELNDRVESIITAISSDVYTIAIESIKNNLLDATRQCLISLEIIERILQDDTESRIISEHIRNLGLEVVKKEQTFPLMKDIIKSLYSIGILQFGYMFDWDRDLEKRQEFLEKEYSGYLAKGLQNSYSNFANSADFKDIGDSNYTMYLDDIIHGEKTLIIGDEEKRDIKCLSLKDINDGYRTTKLFKCSDFQDTGKAYYRIPELLEELTNPILEYALKSPSDKTIKPLTMIIECSENFGIMSIHFRNKFSLNEIIIRSLVEIGDSFDDFKYSKYNKDNKAWEYLDFVTEIVSNSIYKLAIESLKYKFVDFDTLHQQVECLIRIQRKYHNIFHVEDKFERILEMIKEYEIKESEHNEIIKLIENAIEEFKKLKTSDRKIGS
ncbi:hypothetical protein A9239_03535 [Methanosarcina sp. A14]|nr:MULTISPECIES: DUF2254 family protein [Methanosarcina]OEC91152.1 hypothetical protein A9239_03535 [Methanosarcina sp. A14]